MSRILSLPTTYIVCRGETSYDPIGSQGSLHHVEVRPKVQSESINVDLSDLSFESVAIEDGTDLGEHTLQWITTSMSNQTWSNVQNRTLTCDDSIKDTYIDELRFLVTKGYNISGVQVLITGLSITTWPQRVSEYGEFNLVASVTGPQGAVYDLQWEMRYYQDREHPTITKTGSLTATYTFRPDTMRAIDFEDSLFSVTDTVSGLTARAVISTNIWPYAYITGQTNITASGTYTYTGYRCVDDNVLGPQREVVSGSNAVFSLSNAPSGVTIDSSTGVLTVPDNIDSTFDVNLIITNVADGRPETSTDSITVTAYTVIPQVRTVTYDLNNNWMVSTYTHPSDATGMAMFQSESNHNVSGTTATMYIRYSASNTPDSASVCICSNSEPGYDYTKIYALDSESTVAADTSNHQGTPSGLLSTNYVRQNYTIPGDGQTHFIRIDYYKDSSGNQREDRGFVCVAPIDGQVINPYVPQVPIASVDISEVVYMGGGTYEFDVEVSPANADTSALRYDPWYTCVFTSSSMDLGQTWTDTGYGTIKTKGHAYFTGLVSNSGQFGIVLKSDDDPGIFDEYIVTVGDV